MDRRLSILNAIIREFIETAEPVGSQTIMMSYHFSVSPATIRNEMAELENEGLICQPHTSAGRIPTDTGYRYMWMNLPITKLPRNKRKKLCKSFNKLPTAKSAGENL